MNEDFVSFDLAKNLKKKGFNQDCGAYYMPHSDELIYNVKPYKGITLYSFNSLREELISSDFIDAPTISQVLKWLRDEKKIFICIDLRFDVLQGKFVYRFYITNLINQDRDSTLEYYNDWEAAAIAGIEYVLDNLI